MKDSPTGDEAFERFYRGTAAPVRAYILRHCGDRDATDDLFQITYIKFLRSRMARRPLEREARAYLYRIASHVIADHGRMLNRRKRLAVAAYEPRVAPPRPPGPKSLELRAALRKLSKRDQQLLWLIYAEGFEHKEVARIMNLSRTSVRVLAFRARRELARHMGASEAHSERAGA